MPGFHLQHCAKFIVLLMTVTPLCAGAQLNTSAEGGGMAGATATRASAASPADRALVEEVIVIGQRPIASIRKEIFNTEDLIYDTFNELNDDDAFDIICTQEAPIGSQLRRRVCRSRFMITAETDAVVDTLDTGWAPASLSRQQLVTRRQNEIMADLANKNPQFLQLLKKRWALRQVYEKRVEACGWNLKCLN